MCTVLLPPGVNPIAVKYILISIYYLPILSIVYLSIHPSIHPSIRTSTYTSLFNLLSYLTPSPPLFLSNHLSISTEYLFRVLVIVYFHPTFPRQTSQRRRTKWQPIGMHYEDVLSYSSDKTIKILERSIEKATFRTRVLGILSPYHSTAACQMRRCKDY
jgi:hypothetical protein